MARSDDNWQFEGFSSPNFTSVPDEFFDVVAPRLSGSEVKTVLYIIRRTYGFKKGDDDISLSQMQNGIKRRDGVRLDLGVGVSKPSLLSALKSLEQKGIIQRTLQWNSCGDANPTNYRLHMRTKRVGKKADLPPKDARAGVGKKTDLPQVRNLTNRLVKKSTSQYTVNNKQFNNNVNTSIKKHGRNLLHELDDAQTNPDHIKVIESDILDLLKDKKSWQFYRLVARKVPEEEVRIYLSEAKHSTVRNKAGLFTRKVMDYAEWAYDAKLNKELESMAEIDVIKEEISKKFKAG